jgi:threonine aldolase
MGRVMRFFSDNAASVHPAVFEAMAQANHVDTAYDGDARSRSLDAAFSQLFETEVAVLWIATGTAANSLALAAMCPPFRGIVCHRDAHIQNDEAGAPGFYSGGAKLLCAGGDGAKLTPYTINALLEGIPNDVHRTQAAAVSITNASEYGQSYTPLEVAAIGALARARGLRFHMDGARFANAVVHTGATPAELTWRGGVEALSFGFIKNGGLSAEALVLFDRTLAEEVRIRRKQAGHLSSKGRYQAAQILAMLDNDRWLANARAANSAATTLAAAAGDRLNHAVQANEVFLNLTTAESAKLRSQGFDFVSNDESTGFNPVCCCNADLGIDVAGHSRPAWRRPTHLVDLLPLHCGCTGDAGLRHPYKGTAPPRPARYRLYRAYRAGAVRPELQFRLSCRGVGNFRPRCRRVCAACCSQCAIWQYISETTCDRTVPARLFDRACGGRVTDPERSPRRWRFGPRLSGRRCAHVSRRTVSIGCQCDARYRARPIDADGDNADMGDGLGSADERRYGAGDGR